MAHRFEDGGGRELAYVAMSRARHHTTVHVVADDLDQAVEDLRRDWSFERRPRWAIDTGTPSNEHSRRTGSPYATPAIRRAALEAEREALAAVIPPEPSAEIRYLGHALAEMRNEGAALDAARISWWFHPELQPGAERLRSAAGRRVQAEQVLADGELGWRSRRHRRAELDARQRQEAEARHEYRRAVQPQLHTLDTEIADAERRLDKLGVIGCERDSWLKDHPDAVVRLGRIGLELDRLNGVGRASQEVVRETGHGLDPPPPCQTSPPSSTPVSI